MKLVLMNETGVLECEDSDLQALVDRGYVAEVGDDVYEVTKLGEAYWRLVEAGRGGAMRHGELHGDSLEAYVILERALCTCDPDAGLCTCGWDDEPEEERR